MSAKRHRPFSAQISPPSGRSSSSAVIGMPGKKGRRPIKLFKGKHAKRVDAAKS